MNTTIILICVIAYFLFLLAIAWQTSKNSNNDSFFIGNRKSNWMLVAFGMVGTSLSGVTFVSVPGTVGANGFQYFQVVIGYFFGYLAISYILLPIYYKLKLTSIYHYLEQRFGVVSYKTGAMFFVISRALGATARLYLVVNILQMFILNNLGVPFWLTTLVILILILLYTFEGGVKTIVYTDTLQTSFMLLGLVVCIVAILNKLDLGFFSALQTLKSEQLTTLFNTDYKAPGFFMKQIFGGAFIAIAMTGLDQEMMQKNISVPNLKDSQKNVLTLSTILLVVNFLFLLLGGILYIYAIKLGVDYKGDDLFPSIALGGTLPFMVSIIFIIGLISALFPSADGALTALTSSFCIDILGLKKKENLNEQQQKNTRWIVHFSFTILFFLLVMMFKWINDKSIIDVILKVAGYTYGPILGLFAFGILTKREIKDNLSIYVCFAAPIIILVLDFINNIEWFAKKITMNPEWVANLTEFSNSIFFGYKIGIEILIINGLLTMLGLFLISKGENLQNKL